MIFQCLAALFERGRLEFDPRRGEYRTAPRFEMLPRVLEAYEQAWQRHEDRTVRSAYQSFLGMATGLLFRAGETRQARQLFELLHLNFPSPDTAAGFDSFISALPKMTPAGWGAGPWKGAEP
jgi:hypothetical protein